jgi:hypothetical protein
MEGHSKHRFPLQVGEIQSNCSQPFSSHFRTGDLPHKKSHVSNTYEVLSSMILLQLRRFSTLNQAKIALTHPLIALCMQNDITGKLCLMRLVMIHSFRYTSYTRSSSLFSRKLSNLKKLCDFICSLFGVHFKTARANTAYPIRKRSKESAMFSITNFEQQSM